MNDCEKSKNCCTASENKGLHGCCQQDESMSKPGTDRISSMTFESTGCCGTDSHQGASCCGGNSSINSGIIKEEHDCCDVGCCSDAGCCDQLPKNKKIEIEYLYLDLNSCDRCIGTDQVLEGVVRQLKPVLEMAGYMVGYEKIEIENEELARIHQFESSPTIRVNGSDIMMKVKENSCGCCSDISGTNVDCRIFEFEGKEYEVPPPGMLAEAIMAAIFAEKEDDQTDHEYAISENLKNFFAGKKQITNRCCCES